nr:hypothetical protein [Tanacetum cinerariifolium]
MGELTFFLGLQVKQKDDEIFISQDKYVTKILRKFGLTDGKSASTPIDIEKPLLKDPDDSDYAGASLDKKSTTGDDADGVECLPNEEIFTELARMGYEKPPPKLTFYKPFFSTQWKFLIHTIVQCVSAKRTAWNKFSTSMASAVICLCHRIGKGLLGVGTTLFDTMLVQTQVQDATEVEEDEDEDDEVSTAPTPTLPTPATTPLSPTNVPSPPQQQPIPLLGIKCTRHSHCQHEHYTLWEVIEFEDSYVVPASSSSTTTTDTTSGETGMKSGRTVTLTGEDMQRKKNDVKAKTTLLLSLPDEHQLRFKGSETLEQTFNRLQVIVGQLQFMDIEIEQDDLNQKFLTSLAPEWLMHTIVWRNRTDLDTMSLDDLYNHLQVYESEVQKKSDPNSQNMAFISSAKHSSGSEDGYTACVPTASTNVPTASASSDEDDMEEMDIKWNMALLNMRAKKFWKKTWKKISIQGSDMAGFDKSKSYMANDEEDHALVANEVAPTEFALMANTSAESKKWINKTPPLPKYQSWTQESLSNGNLEYNNIFNMSIMPCGSKYKTAQELWAAILKTFGGNEATKKTKKNLLKQQYGNFKAEGSETLEQTFNRLQVIVSQLQFMDVEVEHDDLNQKFLTSLAPEWLMHTIVWRNMSVLDTMSLDDLYNHLKVYESEVQKKSEPNSQNMAFISSAKHSRGNEKVNTVSVSTASTNVPTASANIGVASISQDTACVYIASQSSGSQIKFKDINQIDEDDMEEMDMK